RWEQLEEIAAENVGLAEQGRALADRRDRLSADVAAAAEAADGPSPFQKEAAASRAARDEALARIDGRLAEVRSEAAKVRGEQQAVAGEADRLRPLAEAKRGGRWWTAACWRAGSAAVLDAQLE